MIRAGELRERVTLERWEAEADPRWGTGGGWVTFDTVWASVLPVTARETTDAKGVQTEITHAVTIRHRAGVDSKVRIQWGGRTLEIAGVVDVDGRGRELRIDAIERPTNG